MKSLHGPTRCISGEDQLEGAFRLYSNDGINQLGRNSIKKYPTSQIHLERVDSDNFQYDSIDKDLKKLPKTPKEVQGLEIEKANQNGLLSIKSCGNLKEAVLIKNISENVSM